jgi:cyclopropane fatty-acyl-phospholipid synthase-like methyltransferase
VKAKDASALTEEQYWSAVWQTAGSDETAIDPRLSQFRSIHQFYCQTLAGRRGTLLEVGCGGSRWLPYFARAFGFAVVGIDYSEKGCQQASEILHRCGLQGAILHRDAFAENADLLEGFDVVVSLGLVEHFRNTEEAIRGLARYVKPGGLLISTVPNMGGLLGQAQRLMSREIFEGHVALTPEALAQAHEAAGLEVKVATYIGSLDFHVLNLHGARAGWKSGLYRVLTRLSRIGWSLPFSLPRTRLWSAEVGVSAAKNRG